MIEFVIAGFLFMSTGVFIAYSIRFNSKWIVIAECIFTILGIALVIIGLQDLLITQPVNWGDM